MESELFGTTASSGEEEDSSDESSGSGEEKDQGAGSGGSSTSSSDDSEVEGEGFAEIPAKEGIPEGGGTPEGKSEVTSVAGGQRTPVAGEDTDDVAAASTPGVEVADSQFPSTQDLFGASPFDSSSGESERGDREGGRESPMAPSMSPLHSPSSPPEREGLVTNGDEEGHTIEGIFGDAADVSSSDEEAAVEGEPVPGERPEGEGEVPRINVEIPRCVAQLGSDLHFVKLPNFLSVETRPFDPALYEDEVEEDEVLDEEGRARLKLKVENTIRWRYSQDETGNEIRESNARIVRWSDGSMSLYLGSEIFDIHRQPLQGEFSHLFVRQGTGLQGQAVFRTKLTFRPHSTDSQTHRKMTLSIADRFSKTQKIRVLPAVGKDPESQRSEKIKKEEEKLRAAIRRENQQKRVREKHSKRGLTASYLEPDRLSEGEEEGVSVAAIKSSVKSRLAHGGYESEEGSSDDGAERLMRAKVEESMALRKPRTEDGDGAKRQKRGRKLVLSSEESD